MTTRGASGRKPAMLPGPMGTGVPASLLVVALFLLCHGVFGSLHVLRGDPDHATSRPGLLHGEHAPGAGAPDGGGGETPGGHAAYAAVLAAVLFGARLALSLGAILRWGVRGGAPRRAPILASSPPRLPRGPTAPLLQVFRL